MSAPSVLAKNLRTIGLGVIAAARTLLRGWEAIIRSPYRRVALGATFTVLPLSVGIAAYQLAPSEEEFEARARQQVIETSLPIPAIAQLISEVTTQPVVAVHNTVIHRNDTMGSIFSRLNIDDALLSKYLLGQPLARNLTTPRDGTFLQAKVSEDHKAQTLKIFREAKNRDQINTVVTITRRGDKFTINESAFVYDTRQAMAAGVVKTTLWQAAQDAGVPAEVSAQIEDAFEKRFIEGLQLIPGDDFRLIYERQYLDGDFVRNGKLLAVALTHRGQPIEAFWADDGTFTGNYYDLNGDTTRLAFIRVPVEGARVTSSFMPMRRHPVTGVLRPHMGTDFGAPRGNRIFAAADGVIERKRFDHDGFGHYLVIQHDEERTSLYAHMSRIAKGMDVGVKVKKGDVIGFVGSTGLSTGPHLHYELRHKNRQINPLKVNYPDKDRLEEAEHNELLAKARALTARLAMLNRIQSIKPQTPAAAQQEISLVPRQ